MAIFAGSWLDGAGDPHDPTAKLLQTWTGGGMVALRRHGIRTHPAHAPFVRVARYITDRWHFTLSPADQADWDTIGATGPSRRGSTSRTPSQSFITYAALTWVDVHLHGSTDRTGSETHYSDFTAATLDAVTVGAQTLTYTVDYNAEAAEDLYAAVAAYQVNPAYPRAANPKRQTRLVDLHPLPQAPPFTQQRTVPVAWPVASGDLVRLYVRGRASNYYQFEALLERTA